jgi:hypothetical protein
MSGGEKGGRRRSREKRKEKKKKKKKVNLIQSHQAEWHGSLQL